ncbi:MAG: hypothetical protein PVG51_11300, partial [Desulfosarcina sp.]
MFFFFLTARTRLHGRFDITTFTVCIIYEYPASSPVSTIGRHLPRKRSIIVPKKEDPKTWIIGLVDRFLSKSPLNNLRNKDAAPAWDEALVGFASGADPLFQEYKEYIGPFHWTPLEIYSQYHPEGKATPEDLTVISWVLPQRKSVRDMNRKARTFPAEDWARARIEGERCNAGLRAHVARTLTEKGYPAVAPMLVP